MSPEASPLLSPADDQQPIKEESHTEIAKVNWTSGFAVMWAQAGLFLFAVTLLWVVFTHPAGLFSYHPTSQLGAIIFLSEGILLLQPIHTANQKSKGLNLHQACQAIGVTLSIIGVAVIFYNKRLHEAPHFTTWHGTFGILSVALFVLQAIAGFVIGRAPGQKLLGVNKAKSLWKWHRASGYLILVLLFATPLLATQSSAWFTSNSNWIQRAICLVALASAWAGVTLRANPKKMQLFPSRSNANCSSS